MYSFTGATRVRPTINLGGVGSSTGTGLVGGDPAEVRRRAKAERAAREEQRRRELATIKLQAYWRSRRVAATVRTELRARYDALLAFNFPAASTSSSSSSATLTSADHLELARLLLLFYRPLNPQDAQRLARWAREVVSPRQGVKGGTTLIALLDSEDEALRTSWRACVAGLIGYMLARLESHPTAGQNLLYLELAKLVVDPATYQKAEITEAVREGLLQRIAEQGLWARLRAHILAFAPEAKASSPTLLPAIQLSLLPFVTPPPLSPSPYELSFTRHILTIPLLPNRLPLPALTHLGGSKLPFEGVLRSTPSLTSSTSASALDPEPTLHLLANLLAFSSQRVAKLPSKQFVLYLDALGACLDRVSTATFVRLEREREAVAEKKKQSANAAALDGAAEDNAISAEANEAIEDSEAPFARTDPTDVDGDAAMQEATLPSSPVVDPRTYHWLSTLCSPTHLASLVAASNRSSASSRPALCRFLVALLAAWPAHRERTISTLLFAGTGAGGAGERGGGLLREMWRGYVRSGKLGVTLRDPKAGGSPNGVVGAAEDVSLRAEWEPLILLAELYSRCLLTLGDDEFFNEGSAGRTNGFITTPAAAGGKVGSGGGAGTAQAGRNPLLLDEVVGLAGLLRNIAFGLYWSWTPKAGAGGHGMDRVAGTKVGVEDLRSLCTRLLQQIYARDSRRRFCAEGFWLMTSTFDLQSFIQSVISEEAQLGTSGDHAEGTPAPEGDGEDEEAAQREARRWRAAAGRTRRSQRNLAFLSPRLGVLNNIPFVIPFEQRVAIFRTFVENDRRRLGIERHAGFSRRHRHRTVVRRGRVAEDGFATLNGLGPALKDTIEIVFVDQFGQEEAGIDGGGVFKEFLTSLSKEAFDTDRGLWLATSNQELYPNPHSYSRESAQLAWYGFLGRILGKALYEGILVDVAFAGAFLSKWLGRQSYLDDLASLDPELYRGLLFLKNYQGNVEADLSLNFTVTQEEFGVSRTLDLISDGRNVPVTNENRMRYIYLVSHYRLNVQTEKQSAAFFAGLSDLIDPTWLRLFNQVELAILVGGTDKEMDVDDWASNTVYGGWDESHETVRAFWRVVRSFSDADRRKLLKFCTSCARPPLLGFRELNPSFALRNAGADQTRLPSASTCVNLLKLSAYQSEDLLREKLQYAITSEAGFDLS